MANFVNSKVGLRNRFVLGPMNAVRASTTQEYSYELGGYIDVAGSSVCLTEVFDWPFSEDNAGVAYPGSLYGVRTRTWRQPLADGGGDMTKLTAVPKTLPGGYTLVLRYGGPYGLMHGFYNDYIGSEPANGFTWELRTATGVLIDPASSAENFQRVRWSPMNLDQEVVTGGTSFAYMGEVEGGGDYYLAALAEDHIGFRGGLVTLTNSQVDERSGTVEIWGAPVTGNFFDNGVEIGSLGLTAPPRVGPGNPSVTTVSFPSALPTSDGIRWNYWLKVEPADWTSELAGIGIGIQLSPRVDVPLFYCASMANRVAPGGIILP